MKNSIISMLGVTALLIVLVLQNCSNTAQETNAPGKNIDKSFVLMPVSAANANNYWYQGKAELSTFDVEQERYGEMRKAEQVNIFVTEDFSAKKQVKLDDAAAAGEDRVPILKLNSIRRYETGIYDYSMMLSVFTPTETTKLRTIKTTCTIQDWCGHVFTQTNVGTDGYKIRSFSYFESEGDAETEVKPGLLEDEIWTNLRLSPETYKTQETTVLPATFYCRLRHKPFKAEKARISVEKGASESVFKLEYTDISRKLEIRFETQAPHRILGWTEMDGGKISSKGTLKKMMMTDYWAKHDNASSPLRDSLNLRFGL